MLFTVGVCVFTFNRPKAMNAISRNFRNKVRSVSASKYILCNVLLVTRVCGYGERQHRCS